MQRQRSIFDTFPENVDLNQGPNNNNLEECINRLSPTERRLLSNELSLEINFTRVNANDHNALHNNAQRFSNWDVGESSSRPNLQLNSFNNQQQQVAVGLTNIQSSMPNNNNNSYNNHMPMDVDLNLDYKGGNCNDASSSGTSSDECGPELSFGNWGLSSKRKALEGSGSSSRIPEGESSNVSGSSSSLRINDQTTPRGPTWTLGINNPGHHHHSNVQSPPLIPRSMIPFPWSNNSNDHNNNNNRYFVNDPNNLSLSTGNETGGSSSNAIWTPRHTPTVPGQQRLPDFPPWTLFPASEGDSGGQGHFRHLHSGSSSSSSSSAASEGNDVNTPARLHQPFLRSGTLLEVPDEWPGFNANNIEGRQQRLMSEMRQILNALRRGGESLRAEDFMLYDPFINGVAELHDRHRDMRLDVDNMSYEELLALEERIGDVKTGLSEEVILKSMKQRKHMLFMAISTHNLEPCSICREEYENGDDIGTLDCGHDFHTCCIKQWLAQKNLCPICKKNGLSI